MRLVTNCQKSQDVLKQNGKRETDTEGPYRVSTGSVQENGYGPSHDNTTGAKPDKDRQHCQYERGPCPERPKTFEAPLTADFVPKGARTRTESDTRQSEALKIKDAQPKMGNSHSEVTKVVPLKPQRSKKSLNRESRDVNAQKESPADSGWPDVHMTESKDYTCEASLPKQQQQQHVGREPIGRQELRRSDDAPEERDWELTEGQACGSRAPVAPPRTLPLRAHWSRDTSHVHHWPPGQDASKRKQAVNHLPRPSPHSIIGTTSNIVTSMHELRATILFLTI